MPWTWQILIRRRGLFLLSDICDERRSGRRFAGDAVRGSLAEAFVRRGPCWAPSWTSGPGAGAVINGIPELGESNRPR